MQYDLPVALGSHVRFVSERSIEGIVVAFTLQLRAPSTYTVEYWHDGEPRSAIARLDELEVLEP